jgi:hypothetical protein
LPSEPRIRPNPIRLVVGNPFSLGCRSGPAILAACRKATEDFNKKHSKEEGLKMTLLSINYQTYVSSHPQKPGKQLSISEQRYPAELLQT